MILQGRFMFMWRRFIGPAFALFFCIGAFVAARQGVWADEADSAAVSDTTAVENSGENAAASAEEPATKEPAFDPAALEFFEKEVRPILSARCFECHGPESNPVEGNLSMTSRENLLAGGDTEPAIVPGSAEESLLIDAINYRGLYEMPPKSKMPEAEIAVLTRWVNMGAPWPKGAEMQKFDLAARKAAHWSWRPIAPVDPPRVNDGSWPRDDIDRFILARLEAEGMHPAPDADRRTLVRRLYFDLIGLPPEPEEIRAFVEDPASDDEAIAKLVDTLLASPHFGERWGRHWLDLARYAETYGHEFDYEIPHAWQYRDYVIRALNADVSYDQFVREHLAGDLLAEPRVHPTEGFNESIIGTGFWWFGEATHAPTDVYGDAAGRIDNQIDVMTKTFLGLTVACARCHDHKFDAISTNDFYALAGYLRSSRRQEAMLDPHGKIASETAAIHALRRQGNALVEQLITGGEREGAERPQDEVLADLPRFAAVLLAADEYKRAVRMLKGSGEQILEQSGEIENNVIKKYGITRGQLIAASHELGKAQDDASHPLRLWARWTQRELADANAAAHWLERECRAVLERERQVEQSRSRSVLFADFSRGLPDGWYRTGEAFDAAPNDGRQWLSEEGLLGEAGAALPRLLPAGAAHSGLSGRKQRGVLRSESFEITHPVVQYRLLGEAQVRVIIDGYFMDVYNGLLFGGISFSPNTQGEWQWVAQGGDLRKYIGRRAHLEILDMGDGFVAIDEIRFAPDGSAPLEGNAIAPLLLRDAIPATDLELARAYAAAWQGALDRWKRGEASEGEQRWIAALLAAGYWRGSDDWQKNYDALRGELVERQRRLSHPMLALAMADGSGHNEPVHIRGSHKNLGDPAPRQLLEAIAGAEQAPAPKNGSGRLELAERILSPSNPYPSRVMVNRLWHHFMGRGIVSTVDNFGVLGEPPTHPELLDHLAARFVQEGWSVKRALRAMALSRTYRMSSAPTEFTPRDPANLLWHRAELKRLPGEVIRDSILKVSGKLNPQLFGPGVPIHLTEFMQGRGRPGHSGPLDGGGRRSVYIQIRRNFLSPMMLAFDTPIPFNAVGKRSVSNVPAQALILMNDPFVIEQAAEFARRVPAAKGEPRANRIQAMYERALGRAASETELAAALEFLASQGELYNNENDERLWADFAHVLFNMKDFIYVH